MRGGLTALLLAGCLLGATGCRPPTPTPSHDGTVAVGGRAEDDRGKPLAGVLLRFVPQDAANSNQSLLCKTQASGKFVGKCLPGRYKVTVGAVTTALPGKAGGKDALKPPPLPEGVPTAYGKPATTPWEVAVPAGGKTDIVLKMN
jgi:hypothetical protein